MHIKKLVIKNFQSHKSTTLYLHKYVNVIAPKKESDPNMVGKTSIIRALYWLCFNRPLTASFYSNFAINNGWMSVKAIFKNNYFIKLAKKISYTKHGEKKHKDAYYSLDKVDNFRKFASKVPDVIEKIHNLGEINFAQQLDEPFLIVSTNSKISKEINKVTNLDEVDNWITELNSRIRNSKQLTESYEDNSKNLKHIISKYKGVENIGEKIERLERLDVKIEIAINRQNTLDSLIEKLKETTKKINRIKTTLTSLPRKEIKTINQLQEQITRLENEVEDLSKIQYIGINIRDYEKELKEYKNKYSNMLLKLKQCPTCLNPITKAQVKLIMEEL